MKLEIPRFLSHVIFVDHLLNVAVGGLADPLVDGGHGGGLGRGPKVKGHWVGRVELLQACSVRR